MRTSLAALTRMVSALARQAAAAVAVAVPLTAIAVELADAPIFVSQQVPANVLLALSVEYPTASTPAYLNTTAYDPKRSYLGYFDADKCYRYVYDAANVANSYFKPYSNAASHACLSGGGVPLWSGNYMNWASTHTLDAFRYVLTGGARVVDDASSTVVEKTLHFGNGNRVDTYPDKWLSSGVAGATPIGGVTVGSRVFGLQGKLQIYYGKTLECSFLSLSWNDFVDGVCWTSAGGGRCTVLSGVNTSGSCSFTISAIRLRVNCTAVSASGKFDFSCESDDRSRTCTANGVTLGTGDNAATCNTVTAPQHFNEATFVEGIAGRYEVNVRVKVCDEAAGLEANCVRYGDHYKPEGLMQRYAMSLRYSAFGYLNDDSDMRDGGVMRARMKYIGPTKPQPGAAPTTNSNGEWDVATGIAVRNPDPADALATTAATANTVSIVDSGVINYLNKFGRASGSYKTLDPVSELYYAALRYYRRKGNVPAYSELATDAGKNKRWLDGFPVITNWDDPIAYSCQRNYILGIGDVNTNMDRNLYGNTFSPSTSTEPPMPTEVSTDRYVDVAAATRQVGQLEGMSYLDEKSAGGKNSFYIAGLAYDAHVRDLRADLAGKQTVDTFWMDVLEYQTYKSKNQFWLATKYGGFTVPDNFDVAAPKAPIESAWHTTADKVTDGTNTDLRPDNYFAANNPEAMASGLEAAFRQIVRRSEIVIGTALSTATATIADGSAVNYASTFNPSGWTGGLSATPVSFAADGTPTAGTPAWEARDLLDAVASDDRRIVTCCTATGAALPFRYDDLSKKTLAARTDFASFEQVPGVSSSMQSAEAYVAYLRGDRSQERANKGPYRDRNYRLGDIAGSKVTVVGAPSGRLLDVANPGYDAFRRLRANRKTVVYAGANDGMLHAFDGGTDGCGSCGQELFAYIPSFAYAGSVGAAESGLASLGNSNFVHHALVDSTPKAFDVDFARTRGASGSADWRTILVGGLGKGGRGYYAIDVTDPGDWTSESAVAGKVLWEFSDPTMGYSYGEPIVVKTAAEGWVVILTSGYATPDGRGYLYVVDAKTGALIRRLQTPAGTPASPIDMATAASFSPDAGDAVADAVYAGDLQGNLWRFDPSGASAPLQLAIARDALNRAQPISAGIAVAVSPTSGNRYVMFGTGRLLATSDITDDQPQSFYAIADGKSTAGGYLTSLAAPATFPLNRSRLVANVSLLTGIVPTAGRYGWYIDLANVGIAASGRRVTLAPKASNGAITVAVNRPLAVACAASTSEVFVASYDDGKSMLADASGTRIAYKAITTGGALDLSVKMAGGKIRPYVGDSSGAVTAITQLPAPVYPVKRLNWREVPVTR